MEAIEIGLWLALLALVCGCFGMWVGKLRYTGELKDAIYTRATDASENVMGVLAVADPGLAAYLEAMPLQEYDDLEDAVFEAVLDGFLGIDDDTEDGGEDDEEEDQPVPAAS